MLRISTCMLLLVAVASTATADGALELLHDNYLGKPASVAPSWTLPYDRVAALSSERETAVPESWTADDFVVPALTEYSIQQLKWVALLDDNPSASYDAVDIVVYEANPDEGGAPVVAESPVLEIEGLAIDSLESLEDAQYGLAYYEGTVTLPEELLTWLPEGHYYVGLRAVGNGLGRHLFATTGGDLEQPAENELGAGRQGIFLSDTFYESDWTNVDDILEIPDPDGSGTIGYATDFAFQLFGDQQIIPEPASLSLLALGLLFFRRR